MLSFNDMASYSTPIPIAKRYDPWGIQVASISEEYEGLAPAIREVMTLKQLLDKYSITLGYQNTHLLEILITLMTTGKVCVEFRSHTERLELTDLAQSMTRPATVQLFNEYLAISKEKNVVSDKQATRRITVQLPRITGAIPKNMPRRAPPMP